MKKLLITLFILIFILLTSCQSGFVGENGQLSVKGTQLVNEKGEDVMLRGMSFGWHNWWPRFYNESTVKWLKDDWNVNVVRAVMGVTEHSDSAYFQNPELTLDKIEAVVEGAIKNDIYVIIDWHSHHIFTEEAAEFFEMMAKKYGKYPNVIYEIYNEPVEDSWTELKEYSTAVISAIRKHDPDNIILVGNPHWDQDIHIVADDPIEGFDNIMYTLHFYAGTHKKWLRERGDYALGKGIPIFVSECAGMGADGDGPIDEDEFDAWINWMEENKISWITWSIADKNETCSVLYPSAADDGNWEDEDLKESGKLIRSKLRIYNKK